MINIQIINCSRVESESFNNLRDKEALIIVLRKYLDLYSDENFIKLLKDEFALNLKVIEDESER